MFLNYKYPIAILFFVSMISLLYHQYSNYLQLDLENVVAEEMSTQHDCFVTYFDEKRKELSVQKRLSFQERLDLSDYNRKEQDRGEILGSLDAFNVLNMENDKELYASFFNSDYRLNGEWMFDARVKSGAFLQKGSVLARRYSYRKFKIEMTSESYQAYILDDQINIISMGGLILSKYLVIQAEANNDKVIIHILADVQAPIGAKVFVKIHSRILKQKELL